MRIQRVLNPIIIACITASIYFVSVPAARAEMYYDAEAKIIYEDNVVGLLSDKRGGTAGMPGATMPGKGHMIGATMQRHSAISARTAAPRHR